MDPISRVMLLTLLGFSFIINLIFCESGQMVGIQFEMFNDALNQCNWWSFPVEMQQMLIVVMANSQYLTLIRGYGNVLCTRETFKKVIFIENKRKRNKYSRDTSSNFCSLFVRQSTQAFHIL